MTENVIEFLKDQDTATITLSQGRYISRVKKLAAEHPYECKILIQNKDGSVMAHVPVSWIKISPPRQTSETQRELARTNFLKSRTTSDEKGVKTIFNN